LFTVNESADWYRSSCGVLQVHTDWCDII